MKKRGIKLSRPGEYEDSDEDYRNDTSYKKNIFGF